MTITPDTHLLANERGREMSTVCEHGSLRRQCEICDRDATIASLRQALKEIHLISSQEGAAEGYAHDRIKKIAARALLPKDKP